MTNLTSFLSCSRTLHRTAQLSAFCIFLTLGNVSSFAQAAPAAKSEKEDKPKVVLADHGWSEKGDLVLAISVCAPAGKGFAMGKKIGVDFMPFSLQESYLMVDTTKIQPLSTLPNKPYFGPPYTTADLLPGGNMQLAVAFPTPPNPGKDDKGMQKPYLLRYFPPMGLEPIDIEIPFPAPAPK